MITGPHSSQSKLLGALTVTALKHLGEPTLIVDDDDALCPNWRMARLGEVVLLEKPADSRSPECINCYEVMERSSGGAIKLDRPLYSLRWQHKTEPPDFDLVLLQDEPQHWVGTVNMTLLGELRRRAPQAIDWTGMQDLVPLLDAFEAARR